MFNINRKDLTFTSAQLGDIEHTFKSLGWPYTLRVPAKKATRQSDANAIAQALTEPSGMEVFAYLREAAGCGEWLDEVVESSYQLLGALGPVYFSAMTEASYRMGLGIPASVPGSADMLYVCTLLKQKDYAFSYIAARHG